MLKDELRRRVGVDFIRFPLYRLLEQKGITLVLDIGANRGQFTEELFKAGFGGRVVSFEPIPDVFGELKELAGNYHLWQVVNAAVGGSSGTRTLHRTVRDTSSSFYGPAKRYADRYEYALSPSLDVDVKVVTLDETGDTYVMKDDRVFVKMDVQGAELDVIHGGADFISSCCGLQVETSLVPVYEGVPAMEEVIGRLRSLGFVPVWVTPGFKDPQTWQAYDCDIIFLPYDHYDLSLGGRHRTFN